MRAPIPRSVAGAALALLLAALTAAPAAATEEVLSGDGVVTNLEHEGAAPVEGSAGDASDPDSATAVEETAPAEHAAPVEEPATVAEPTSGPAAADPSSTAPSADPVAPDEQQLIASAAAEIASASDGTAALSGTPLLGPGESHTATYETEDATRFHLIVLGLDAQATATIGTTTRSVVRRGEFAEAFASLPGSTGTITVHVTNRADTARVVPFVLEVVEAGPVTVDFSSAGDGYPTAGAIATARIDGVVTDADSATLRVIGADGVIRELDMPRESAGSVSRRASLSGFAPGSYLLETRVTVAGAEYARVGVVRVAEPETTPPVVVMTTEPAASNARGWFRQRVQATLAASDPDSGVRRVLYRLGDSGPFTPVGDTNVTIPLGHGEHTLEFFAEDRQGNDSQVASRLIRVDLELPTVQITGLVDEQEIERDAEVRVEFTCGDALSGVFDCASSIENGEALDTSTPGRHRIDVVAVDRAGNQFSRTMFYRVLGADEIAPEVSLRGPGATMSGWHTDAVHVEARASDDNSGVSRLHWRISTADGVVEDEIEAASVDIPFAATGEYLLEVWAVDAAGNIGDARSIELRVDLDAPTIGFSTPREGGASDPSAHYGLGERIAVDYDCGDIGSGIAECEGDVPVGGMLPTDAEGTFQFWVTATDVAGNTSSRMVAYSVAAAAEPTSDGERPRLADTGVEGELVGLGLFVVALLLAAGAVLLTARRLGGR